MVGATISPYFEKDNTIIAWYLVNPYKSNMELHASITTDGGVNWSQLSISNEFTKVFFSDYYAADNIIYAAEPNKISSSQDGGHTWKDVVISDAEILDAYTKNNKILLLTENGLQVSLDKGLSWSELDTPSRVQSTQFDDCGNIYILADDKILKESNGSWINIETLSANKLLRIKIIKDNLIVFTSNNTMILDVKSNKWSVINDLDGIENIFIDSKDQIYALINDNSIAILKEDKKLNSWATEKINIKNEGKVVDIISGNVNDLYFCISSNLVWEEMGRK